MPSQPPGFARAMVAPGPGRPSVFLSLPSRPVHARDAAACKRQLDALVRDLTVGGRGAYDEGVPGLLELIEGLFVLGILAGFIYVLVGVVRFIVGVAIYMFKAPGERKGWLDDFR